MSKEGYAGWCRIGHTRDLPMFRDGRECVAAQLRTYRKQRSRLTIACLVVVPGERWYLCYGHKGKETNWLLHLQDRPEV